MKFFTKTLVLFALFLIAQSSSAVQVTIQLLSYVANGGTNSVNWSLAPEGQAPMASGTATFNMMTFQYTTVVEVEAGCYQLLVMSNNTLLSESNFLAAVMIDGNIVPPTEPVLYGSIALTYNFCTGTDTVDCVACFTPSVFEGYLNINNCSTPVDPENTTFAWDFGDGTTGEGPMPTHQYLDNGIYEICVAMIVYAEGQVVCIDEQCQEVVVEGLVNNDCPDAIWSGAGEGCGWMNFEIGSFIEGEEVTWYFNGWDSEPVVGGHFIEHYYVEPGVHVVCAFYTSPNCNEGVEICTEVVVEECNIECPTTINVEQIDCDSYLFCIAGVDDGNVSWSFGDGVVEGSGPCADHSYAENGEYVIIAQYSGPSCPFGVVLTQVINVNCDNDCPNSIVANYNCPDGTVSLYVPGVPESQNMTWYYQGAVYETENNWFTVEVPNSWVGVCVWSAGLQELGCPEICTEIFLGCENNECELGVAVIQQIECDLIVLQATGYPEGATVYWTQNEMLMNVGNITTFLLQPGENHLCAYYETELCGGVVWCETFWGCDGPSCPDEIWSGAGDGCGVMNFEIGSFVEGESVTWYPGDESGAVEDGHFWSHTYAEPGSYNVCAFYTSPNCPDGVELCTTIVVESCEINGDCPTEISHSENQCGWFSFEIGSFQEGESVDWYFGDVMVADQGHFTEYQFDISGEIQVCAFYTSNACPDGVWLCTIVNSELCGDCTNVNFSLDSFMEDGGPAYVNWNLSNGEGIVVAEGVAQYTPNDPWYDYELCLEDGCYTLHICSISEFPAESFDIIAGAGWEIVDITPIIGNVCIGYDVLISLNGDCTSGDCEASFEPIFTLSPGHVEFENTSTYKGAAEFTWSYGNGQVSYNQGGNVWYTENGTYLVCLTVFTADCQDTYCEEIVIDDFEEECSGTEINLVVQTNYPGDGEDEFTVTITGNGAILGTFPFISCDICPEVFEIALCVPDGCYEVEFNSDLGISAEEILIAAFLLGSEIPLGEVSIGLNGETGSFEVGINDDCVDGVEDLSAGSLSVYPNPAAGVLNISASGNLTNAQIVLTDATGRVVLTHTSMSNICSLDVSHLADGVYTVKCSDNINSLVKQVIISH